MSATASQRYKGLSLDQLATLCVVEARTPPRDSARLSRAEPASAAAPGALLDKAAVPRPDTVARRPVGHRRTTLLVAGLLLIVGGTALTVISHGHGTDTQRAPAINPQSNEGSGFMPQGSGAAVDAIAAKSQEPRAKGPVPSINSRPHVLFASDTTERFTQVQRLLTSGEYFERNAAYAELLKSPELPQRIGELIRRAEGEALLCYVRAAAQLEMDAACEALIERLERSTNNEARLRRAILDTLAVLRCESAEKFVLCAVKEKRQIDPHFVWPSVGRHMSEELRRFALRGAAAGEEIVADALARFAQGPESSAKLSEEIRQMLSDATDEGKRLLARVAGALRPEDAGSLAFDLANYHDPLVRAAVVGVLYRNPAFRFLAVGRMQNDSDSRVKAACIEAAAGEPDPTSIPALIFLLNNAELRFLAHKALVRAARGEDLGWRDFEWRAWHESRQRQGSEGTRK